MSEANPHLTLWEEVAESVIDMVLQTTKFYKKDQFCSTQNKVIFVGIIVQHDDYAEAQQKEHNLNRHRGQYI